MQACVSCNDVGHAAPPLAACCVMVRVRACTPPPHVAEHAFQALHSDTPQSTGQPCVLQACVWDKDGHATPPLADERMTVRVLVWEPPPQRVEHADHAAHSLTRQSTGHGWVLQACSAANAGQGTPPLAAATTTLRVWVCTPEPHAAEHADHAENSDTTQLTAQGWVLHV